MTKLNLIFYLHDNYVNKTMGNFFFSSSCTSSSSEESPQITDLKPGLTQDMKEQQGPQGSEKLLKIIPEEYINFCDSSFQWKYPIKFWKIIPSGSGNNLSYKSVFSKDTFMINLKLNALSLKDPQGPQDSSRNHQLFINNLTIEINHGRYTREVSFGEGITKAKRPTESEIILKRVRGNNWCFIYPKFPHIRPIDLFDRKLWVSRVEEIIDESIEYVRRGRTK